MASLSLSHGREWRVGHLRALVGPMRKEEYLLIPGCLIPILLLAQPCLQPPHEVDDALIGLDVKET